MTTATTYVVHGRDLRPGDVVTDLAGRNRTLTGVEPYAGIPDWWDGQARTGTFDGQWRMTLEPTARFRVVRIG